MKKSRPTIQLVSDTALSCGAGALTFVDSTATAVSNRLPLWVVEHSESVDTIDLQEQARLDGREVLVCSFHRHTVEAIGHCRIYVGSIAAVAAASGFTIHNDADILRASRELRGRLAAKTVAVLEDRYLHVVDGQRAATIAVDGVPLAEILLRIANLDKPIHSTHAA